MVTEDVEVVIQRDKDDHTLRMTVASGVLVIIIVIFATITLCVYTGYANDTQRDRQRQQTAQHCTDAGYIWVANNCLPREK